jgi:hypothetical protein
MKGLAHWSIRVVMKYVSFLNEGLGYEHAGDF